MDQNLENKQNIGTPVPPTANIPASPVPNQNTTPTNSSNTPQPKGFNKTILLLVVVVIMAIVVGAIYILAIKSNSQTAMAPAITPAPQRVVTPTLAPTPATTDTGDINNLDLGDPQQDLNSINKNLQQL